MLINRGIYVNNTYHSCSSPPFSLNFVWAKTLEEKLLEAYQEGYAVGYFEGYENGSSTVGSVSQISDKGFGITSDGNIILGGDKSQPSSKGYNIELLNKRWPYSSSQWKEIMNSPIVTDEAREIMDRGGSVRFKGFAFDRNSILPGIGELSFGDDTKGFTEFTIMDHNTQFNTDSWLPLDNGRIKEINDVKKSGVPSGIIIYKVLVE